MKETKEPLAKFHARPDPKGRVLIPKGDREVLGIRGNDYVEALIRKVRINNESIVQILGSALIIAKVGIRGYIVVPTNARVELNLSHGDAVEVLILAIHKFDKLISPQGKELMKRIQAFSQAKIISPGEEYRELEIIKKLGYYYSYSMKEEVS